MTTTITTGTWTDDEELLRIYGDVALCRTELAGKRPAPPTLDNILFAMTEMGEYSEAARLRPNTQYVRNNERQFDARRELAQVGEMIFTAIWTIDTEERIQDAGGAMIGQVTYHLAVALMSWSRGQRSLADSALELAAKDWRDLALLVGEQPQELIAGELNRIRGKFTDVAAQEPPQEGKDYVLIDINLLPTTPPVMAPLQEGKDYVRIDGIVHMWPSESDLPELDHD